MNTLISILIYIKKLTSWFYQLVVQNSPGAGVGMHQQQLSTLRRALLHPRPSPRSNKIGAMQANKTRDLPRYDLDLKSIPRCLPSPSLLFAPQPQSLLALPTPLASCLCLPAPVCPLSTTAAMALWRQHPIANFPPVLPRCAAALAFYGSRIPFEIHADL